MLKPSTLFLLALCTASPQANGFAGTDNNDSQPKLAIHQLSKAASAALRKEAKTKSATIGAEAARELVAIYEQITQHDRFATSETLQRRAGQIRQRLKRVHQKLVQSQRASLPQQPDAVLKQQFGANGAGNRAQNQAALNLGDRGLNGAANANAGNANDSAQLIDLIERTITPSIWEAAGGSASMAYFHPSLALVVTADHETHRKVAGLLTGLRQAGP